MDRLFSARCVRASRLRPTAPIIVLEGHPDMGAITRSVRGIGAAVRSRPRLFAAVALGVFALDILVPPLVLSLARKPVSAFSFNPWLPSLPGYLASGPGSLGERLDKAWGLALLWFSAD